MSVRIVMLTVALIVSGPSIASTPQAWRAMDKRVDRACVAMSGLARPVLLASKIRFSDTIGVEIRQLRGTDTRGRTKRLLCAYTRATGRTEVQEAGAWNGPVKQP